MSPLKDEAASFINRIFQRCGLSFTTNLRPISCYLPVVTKDLPLSFDIVGFLQRSANITACQG